MSNVISVTRHQRFWLGQALVGAVMALHGEPSVLAQSAVLSTGAGSGTAGATVSIPINLTSSGAAQIVGIQWTFSFSSDITGVTVFAGPSATNAQKSVSCSGTRCLVFGFNNNVVAEARSRSPRFKLQPSLRTPPSPLRLRMSLLRGPRARLFLPVEDLETSHSSRLPLHSPFLR